MAAVNVRELARNTSKVIGDVARRKRPTIITRGGRPVAAVVPIDAEALEDWILANSPVFVEGMREADAELRRGETVGMTEAFARAEKRPRRQGGRVAKPRRAAKRPRR
jgi:prevent-host-death family protein